MTPTRSHFELPGLVHDVVHPVGASAILCHADGWNDQNLHGELLDFDPLNRLVKIRPQGQVRGISLRFNQIKRLSIETLRALESSLDDPAASATQSAQMPPQAFLASLRDGSHLSGQCLACRKVSYGYWVFVKGSTESIPTQFFLPRNAVLSFTLGSQSLSQFADTDFAQTLLQPWQSTVPQALEFAVGTAVVENLVDLQRALQRQASLTPVPIGEALIGLGKITAEQLSALLRMQQSDPSRQPLGQLLVSQGLVSPAELQTALARKMGYPFVDLTRFPIETAALQLIPLPLAQRLQALPIVEIGKTLVVAMSDPLQFKVIDELEFTSQRKVVPVVSVSSQLAEIIQTCYRDLGLSALAASGVAFGSASSSAAKQVAPAIESVHLAAELNEIETSEPKERPIEQSDNALVRMVNSMIVDAYQQGASDIHIEPYPGREKMLVRFRVDGQLRDYLRLPANYRNALVARLKVMSDLDISERRKPQDGKIRFSRFGDLELELRVATLPTASGLEDVVLRLLSAKEPLPLEKLNLSPHNLRRFEALVDRPYGLFLCVGPTGSGKTTTLHSALNRLNTPERKIWTAEDPVEITQRGLRQIQVNARIGLTFATALRAVLRADPDVIMVGEIRDHETAQIAIESSLTGHLVFSTLHTNSAAETVVRLMDLGVDPFSFSDSLQGVLAQRLVRRLCSHCVATHEPSEDQLQELLSDYQAQLAPDHPWRDSAILLQHWRQHYGSNGQLLLSQAHGCERCQGSGLAGRLALHELLCVSPVIRALVQQRARPDQILLQAQAQGMRTLRQDGIEKVLLGLTTLSEVRSNTVI